MLHDIFDIFSDVPIEFMIVLFLDFIDELDVREDQASRDCSLFLSYGSYVRTRVNNMLIREGDEAGRLPLQRRPGRYAQSSCLLVLLSSSSCP
jgi:hypothetical protein